MPARPGPSVPAVRAVVINADDLGISEIVNAAIMRAFEKELVTSATIMANMPAFADACAEATRRGLADRIGVHLNLTAGQSLTGGIKGCPRLSAPDGTLQLQGQPRWRLTADERAAVHGELAAQLDAVLATGIRPSHVDSHHHVHTQWPIGSIVMRLVREYQIPAVRLTRNCGPGISAVKGTYKRLYNARLSRSGLAAARWFGSARDVTAVPSREGAIEIMVHPSLDADGQLVDLTDPAVSLEHVAARWREAGRLVAYRELLA
jgi:predicted glycoside hydrolase/deacetylase ChbG (UPF0249 family)